MSSDGGTHTSSVSVANGRPGASRSTRTSSQPQALPAFEVSDDLSGDPVDRPDHDDRSDIRPEAVDGEVRGDPLREREHRDVDQEVEEAERPDDTGQRQDREWRLDNGVRDAKNRRADQVRRPAVDRDAGPKRIRDPER